MQILSSGWRVTLKIAMTPSLHPDQLMNCQSSLALVPRLEDYVRPNIRL